MPTSRRGLVAGGLAALAATGTTGMIRARAAASPARAFTKSGPNLCFSFGGHDAVR